MITRAQVVAEARTWIGTPWQHQHRRKGAGVDCLGLLICVARELGLTPPGTDFTGYGRRPDGSLLPICDEHMTRIQKSELRPGDVVVVAADVDPAHMGIVGDYQHGGLSIIHASTHHMKVVEHRLLFLQNFRFKAAYALPGVD